MSVDVELERIAARHAEIPQDGFELDGGPLVGRRCAWCRGPIPDGARVDSVCCSTRCRQARHRFTRGVGVGTSSTSTPLRLAYADPPYPGNSRRYYAGHRDFAGEVDHAALLEQLAGYDGWALSTSAAALPAVLALCPAGVRVAAWFHGARGRSTRPLNAWEPVIYAGGRAVGQDLGTRSSQLADPSRGSGRRVDALVHVARPRTTDPNRVIGAKPAVFARWVFDLLGAAAGDQLDDLFPGSGAISRAWATYTAAPAAQTRRAPR